tara:strand:+ start:17848 stop:18999 length:1152 start_codon:yes stop_codon:yes gene_type:complete
MKILFVCQQYIHSARWINQLKDTHHEVFVFDCLDRQVHKDLQWTTYFGNWSQRKIKYLKGEHFLKKKFPNLYDKVSSKLMLTSSEKLSEIIKEIQPDLVHSLEMQSQTYPLIKVRKKIDFNWAYFSWGSDLFFYRDKKHHQFKIQNVLSQLNYLFTDNSRDINIAKEFGFSGDFFSKLPGGGGYDLKKLSSYKKPFNTRNLILIKGYDHWAGKAIKVLESLEFIIKEIKNYNIYVYSAHENVIDKINQLNFKYNLDIQYSSRNNEISQESLLEKFGQAKIAIGNSVTDGIPNTLLEAIILGAFPIQSNPGGVSEEYIKDGLNGFLIVDPENPKEIASKIKHALNNNELLESANSINEKISLELSNVKIKKRVIDIYDKIERDL